MQSSLKLQDTRSTIIYLLYQQWLEGEPRASGPLKTSKHPCPSTHAAIQTFFQSAVISSETLPLY